jgi:hypothetical protein
MKNNFVITSLCIFLLFSALSLYAQVDPKYLKGAVPEKDGKVIFSDTINLLGMNKEVIYEKALKWANENFHTEKNRVVYTNPEQGTISCRCESEMLFSAGTLSLDRAYMNYQLNIYCDNGSCRTDIKSIHYLYNVSSKKEPEKYYAEDWITDKEAVNKDKLFRNNGKFRIKTIDLVDDIHDNMYIALSKENINLYSDKNTTHPYSRQKAKLSGTNISPVQNNEFTQHVQVKQLPVTTGQQEFMIQTNPKDGTDVTATISTELSVFKKIDPQKIPGNIIKMLSEDWMLITAGNNESKFNMMTASWGGLGHFWSKPVAFFFINPARYTYQLMKTNDTYTLSFYTETYREALRYCGSSSGKDTDKVRVPD